MLRFRSNFKFNFLTTPFSRRDAPRGSVDDGAVSCSVHRCKQESPANADKPAQRESMPKIAPIRRENKLQTT